MSNTIGSELKRAMQALSLRRGEIHRNLPDLPFDSFSEQRLWNQMKWAVSPTASLLRQVRVADQCAYDSFMCRLDFLIVGERRSINVECDGEMYHEAGRDQRRDYRVIGMGKAHRVYRFVSGDAWNNAGACVAYLALIERDLFAPGPAKYLWEQHGAEAMHIEVTTRGEAPADDAGARQ